MISQNASEDSELIFRPLNIELKTSKLIYRKLKFAYKKLEKIE